MAGALAYASALGGEFVFDDRAFLVDNAKLDRLGDIPRYFGHGVWAYSNVTDTDTALYRPLFLVVLAVGRALWADSALAYHLVSVALHLANSLLVLLLVTRLFRDTSWLPPFAGALLFVLHPAHVEAVAWISAVVHLLVTGFLLASFLLYLEHQETRATAPLIGAVVAFGLALLTQETAVTYPAILVAHEFVRRVPRPHRRVLPFVVLLAGYFALRRLVLGVSVPLAFASTDAWSKAAMLAAGYLKPLIVPWPQPLFLRTPDEFPGPWSLLVAAAAVVTLAALLAHRPRGSALLWLATAWCAITSVPPIAAAFHPRQLFALRSLYLPSVAIAIYAAWLVAYPLRARPAPVLGGLAVLAAVFGAFVGVGNGHWKNDGVVYARILETSPGDAAAHAGLGRYFERTGREDLAIRAFGDAARHGDGTARAEAYESLGVILGKRGRRRAKRDVLLEGARIGSGPVVRMGRAREQRLAAQELPGGAHVLPEGVRGRRSIESWSGRRAIE